jgi:hypothetical protein
MIQQLTIPLFDQIQDAIVTPGEADLLEFLRAFDQTISELDDQSQLEVGATLILQLAILLEAKYAGEVEKTGQFETSEAGPVVSIDFFDRFVRQSISFSFDPFIEPIPLLQIPGAEEADWRMYPYFQMEQSVNSPLVQEVLDAVIDDAAALLETLPDRTEQQQMDAIKALSHGEQIQTWSEELQWVVEVLQQRKKKQMPFLDLIYTLKLSRPQSSLIDCFTEMWITLMLGNHPYTLIRGANDFYSAIGIEVVLKTEVT